MYVVPSTPIVRTLLAESTARVATTIDRSWNSPRHTTSSGGMPVHSETAAASVLLMSGQFIAGTHQDDP